MNTRKMFVRAVAGRFLDRLNRIDRKLRGQALQGASLLMDG